MQHCIELIRYFDEMCYIQQSVICSIINYVSLIKIKPYKWFENSINDVYGKVSWSLRRSPFVLFTLFCTFFRCKLKFNLVSNIIPRCLWVDDDLTKFSLKYNRRWSVLLIFLLQITSWACFFGSGLNLRNPITYFD